MLLLNILLRFVLISVAIGTPKNKVASADLSTAKKLHMGFLKEFKMRAKLSRENLASYTKKHNKHIFKQLECSYALFAMRYVRIIELILVDPIGLAKGDLENFLFDDEAAAMLAASIHNTSSLNGVTNAMWAFWLYADRVHRFLDSTKKSGQVDDKNHSATFIVHKAVNAVLDRFLTSYECKFHDEIQGELEQLTDQILRITEENADKSKGLIGLIGINKEVFDKQKSANSSLGILTSGQQHISMRTLSLNDLMGIQKIVVRSVGTEFWETIENWLSSDYNYAMALDVTLNKQAESLIIFQKQFTDTLKLVALHFSRHFLLATANTDVLVKRIIQFITELEKLDRLIKKVISEHTWRDATLDHVISYIHPKTPICETSETQQVVKHLKSVEEIESVIASILSQSTIPAIALSDFPINNYYNSSEGSDFFHASIVEQMKLFVKTAIEVWSDVDFGIVNSFIKYTSSEERHHVAEF